MSKLNKSSFGKRVSAALLALLLCLPGLTGCGRRGNADITVPDHVTPTASTTVTATPTPSPTPEPWTAYEKIGGHELYRVPVKELSGPNEITGVSTSGDYLAMQVWEPTGDMPGPEWGRLVLLRPAKSGESASMLPDYPVNGLSVFADGSVMTAESVNAKIHVYDASWKEQRAFVPFAYNEPRFLDVTEDGLVFIADNDNGKVGVCDRFGENKKEYVFGAGRRIYSHLGCSGGVRYFRGFDNDENSTDTIFCLNEEDGSVTVLEEKTVNVMTGQVSRNYTVEKGMLCHISKETWFVRRMAVDDHRLCFPKYYAYEGADLYNGNRIAVQGTVRGAQDVGADHRELRGCRIYDLGEKMLLGELTTDEAGGVASFTVVGLPERNLAYLTAGSWEEGYSLLLWDLSQEQKRPMEGFCDLTEKSPRECLAELWGDYKEAYGIEYTPSTMKVLSLDDEIAVLKEIDFANMIARGVAGNPEEFARGEDGIALRIENIRGHKRGHSAFRTHVMTALNKEEYGEDMVQTFYNLVDAIRDGEDWFEATDRFAYNWSLSLFATWFYPVASGCIKTSYDYRDKDVYVGGKGRVPYTVSKEEAEKMTGEFEQLVCDILDDCIADGYTDFEKALAIYEFMTEYCTYDYYTYQHINEPEITAKGHIYRCFTDGTGICWALAGMYDYLLLQCGVNVEEVEGFAPSLDESHAWSCIVLDGQAYYVDVTWALSGDSTPKLAYFCFTDDVRDDRDGFPIDQQKIVGYETLSLRTCPVQATDRRFEALWDGYYVGMDRAAKDVIYIDADGVLRRFSYGK